MVNDIITGIARKINSDFGDSYKIYDRKIEQGLDKPCFFVKLVNASNRPFLRKRKRRDFNFDVHYFPQDESDNEEMMDVGIRLLELIEYITLPTGEIMRGHDMSFQIIDGVLHMFITYSAMLNDLSKADEMDSIETEVRT